MNVNTISNIEKLEDFLKKADKLFPVPLSEKVNLHEYAVKLFEKATLCSFTVNGDIVGLAGGYTENTTDNLAYLSLLCVLPEFQGKGIGYNLVNRFINISESKKLRGVHLYAVKTNLPAMKMYNKMGFEEFITENELRPNDAHLIYVIGDKTER